MLLKTHQSITSERPHYRPYTLHNMHELPQVQRLSAEQRLAIEVVARVLPFRTNNYVVDSLIDWQNVPDDPLFVLNFPQREMLQPDHFAAMVKLVRNGASEEGMRTLADEIRFELNPHPAGQLDHNRPLFNGQILNGVQHKYAETVLFFPSQGQTCHAYCSFCFRWPQFVGMNGLKFAMREVDTLVAYLRQHPLVTDVLFTGGDPLVMRANVLAHYLEPLLAADLPSLTTIRIGTKALGFWPYRFITDPDAAELLALFRKVVASGRHLALMAHFSHPRELSTAVVQEAITRIRETGAEIRTQAPLLAHINDDPHLWAEMWRQQVALGCIPYYMFVTRDTGAQHYFGVPLGRVWDIFRRAFGSVSGVARTVRGPIMSAYPGKVQVMGITEVGGQRVFVLQLLQGRDPDWVLRPFFARFDSEAIWFDELQPAFGTPYFFEAIPEQELVRTAVC